MRRHTNAGPIANVKAQGFVRAVAIQANTAVRFRQDVHVNDGRNRPEILRHANADVRTLAVDVAVAQRYGLLPTSYCVVAKVTVVDLLCKKEQNKTKRSSDLVLRGLQCLIMPG